jgi:hypothetical protein
MRIDVFISYSSKDKPTADAACAALEAAGVRCWIAPRDILPGQDWGAAIVDAIDDCRLVVLVFSADANESPQIRNEVVRAVNRGVPIIPVRIDDITPTKALAYFMGSVHWLDALTPPLEKHLETLAATVKTLLQRGKQEVDDVTPDAAKPLPASPRGDKPRLRRKPSLLFVGIVGVLVIGAGITLITVDLTGPGGGSTIEAVQLFSPPSAQDLQHVSDIAAKNQLPVPTFSIVIPKVGVPVNALRFIGVWASSSGYNGTGRQAMLIVTAVDGDSFAEGYYVQGPPTAGTVREARIFGPSAVPIEGRITGNTLTFTHEATDTKFVAKFDINADYLTVGTTLRSGLRVQIVLNPVWRLVKRE